LKRSTVWRFTPTGWTEICPHLLALGDSTEAMLPVFSSS